MRVKYVDVYVRKVTADRRQLHINLLPALVVMTNYRARGGSSHFSAARTLLSVIVLTCNQQITGHLLFCLSSCRNNSVVVIVYSEHVAQ